MAVAAGGAIGLLNGLLIAVGNLNPFIVTLGTNFLFTGLAFVLTDGESLVIEDDGFRDLGRTDVIGDLSTTTVVMAASFAVGVLHPPHDPLRHPRLRDRRRRERGAAVRRARDAREDAGLRDRRSVRRASPGVMLAASSGSIAPFQAAGQNDLLIILAAVIIGGTALEGGRGTVIGTLVGILLLGIISNGLVLEDVSSFWQPVVVGTLLLIAIILDEVRRRAALKVVR